MLGTELGRTTPLSVAIRADREGTHVHLVSTGPFDSAHAMSAARAVESAEASLRVDPRGTIVQIDFELFLDRLNTIGLDVKRLQTITDIGVQEVKVIGGDSGNPTVATIEASYHFGPRQ